MERRLHRRRQWISATVTTLVAALVLVLSLTYQGVATADVDLHDGGVWVTNDQSVQVGRLNEPVGKLDASLAGTSRSLDVLQQGSDVFLLDRQVGAIQRIDTATVQLADASLPLPANSEVEIGRNTVGIFDPHTGNVWSLPFDGLSVLADPTAVPAARVGENASLAVADDGTVYTLDPVPSEIVTIEPETREALGQDGSEGPDGADGSDGSAGSGESENTGESEDTEDTEDTAEVPRIPLGENVDLSTSTTQLTALGDTPVALAYDDQDRTLELLRPEAEPIDLTGTGVDLASARIQAPSAGSSEVFIATSDALLAVPLDGSEPRIERVQAGTPTAPVQVAGCAHGAWASGEYVRSCTGAEPIHEPIPGYTTGQLKFRVNHELVVLNNLDDGDSWLLEDTLILVDNWTEVTPPSDEEAEEEDSQDLTRDDVPLDQQENHDPVAQDDEFGVRAGGSVVLPVLFNDSDPDGDLLTVTDVGSVPENFGALELVHDGRAVQLHAGGGAGGTVQVDYSISDGRGGSSDATISMRVVPESVNEPPTQVEDIGLTVASGATTSVDVLTSVQDPDGDPVYVVSGESTEQHDVVVNSTGLVQISDRGLTTGERTVPITVSDGRSTAEVVIALTVLDPGPVPPEVVFDYAHGFTGAPIDVSPLVNDRDPAGKPLRLAQVGEAEGATISPRLDDGIFTLTAPAAGSYYVQYTAANDDGLSAEGLVRVDVSDPVQAPPTAVADTALLPPGGTVLVDVLANDVDPSGGVIAVERVDAPGFLSVSVTDHRLLEISSARGFTGPATLDYTVSNGYGRSVGTVTVIPLPVSGTALPPVARPDTARVRAGDYVTIPVLANDTHPDGLPIELRSQLVEVPDAGMIFTSQNTVRFKAPDEAQTLEAIYAIEDSNGQSSSATITIYVVEHSDEVNSAPRPEPVDVRAFAGERIRIPIDLVGIDPDGDSVTLAGVYDAPTLGRVVEVGTGWLDYRAASDAQGIDTFSYLVVDRLGATATAEIQVGVIPPPATNSPPLAVADHISVRPGRAIQVDVLANDTDADGDQLTFGVPAFTQTAGLDLEVQDSLVTFTSPDEEGPLVLGYQVTDRRGGTTEGTLTVEVSADAPLHQPVAVDDVVPDHAIIDAETATLDVLANDWDPDGARSDLSLSITDPSTTEAGARIAGGQLEVTVPDTREVLVYTVTDSDGLTGHAFVEMPGRLDTGPVLRPDVELSVNTGEELAIDLADVVVAPSGRPVQLSDAAATVATNSDGTSPVVDNTTLRFVSADDYVGPATLTFRVTDAEDPNANGILVSTLTLPIQVLPIGAVPPTMRGGSVDLEAGGDPQELILGQLTDDVDTDVEDLTYEVVDQVAGFDAQIVDGMVLRVSADIDTAAGASGNVTVRATDPEGGSGTAAIAVRALASTEPLIVTGPDDLGEVHQGVASTIDVLANDSNPFPGETRTITDATVESGSGTVTIDGANVVLTPSADYVGRMSVVYRVVDVTGQPERTVEGRVSASVLGVPEQPAPPRIESVGNAQVVVSITPPVDNGAPISSYIVTPSGAAAQQCANTTCTLSGLTNGTTYTFTVAAVNEVGESPASNPSADARPDVKPAPVTPPTLTFGDQEITADWTAPANEGTPIREYQLQISPAPSGSGQQSLSGGTTSYTWTGLSNGTAYQFRLRAINDAPDPGDWGPWSATEIPAGLPDAPAVPTVARVDTPAGGQIDVAWTKPFENGAAIAAYWVTMIEDGSAQAPVRFDPGTTSHRFTVVNGRDYGFRVAAENKAGTSDPSAASAPVRSFGKPGIPTSVDAKATGANGTMTLDWTVPSDNGQAISKYEYSVDGGSSWTAVANGGSITGLTNGQRYQVIVHACNTYCGDPSTPDAVTPYGPPGEPTLSSSNSPDPDKSKRSITFSWTAGNPNGATVATQYRIDGGSWKNANNTDSVTVNGVNWEQQLTIDVRVTNTPTEAGNTPQSVTVSTSESMPKPQPPGAPSIAAPEIDKTHSPTKKNPVMTFSWSAGSDQGAETITTQYRIDGGSWQNANNSGTVTKQGQWGQKMTIEVRATNNYGDSTSATKTADPGAQPWSAASKASIDASVDKETVKFDWSSGSATGATIDKTEIRITGTSGWNTTSASGSKSVKVGYSSTAKVEIRQTTNMGDVTTATLSKTTGAKPRNPSATLSRGPAFTSGCQVSSCTPFKVTFSQILPGSYTADIYQDFGGSVSLVRTESMGSVGANGSWTSSYGVYAGKNNGTFWVVIRGPETLTTNKVLW
ncbi:Ig-like domain-containing protein [Pseudactinotalea sp. HY158]|uniref:Ig-like domain-containing protein n=1 Tax=Pseudactinotalea sp. HY158 TaxID=2654547 RepID=UPI00129C4222|nr:Ig-like domain-containing protein [Pseudactinotalea sp. HY158]QGH69546.1 tandem-95 repeat protein [Pseudactinotalea sp. HY158]